MITHVSDTARWTALYRATESARADALFRDPLAERLAGEQGRAIVAKTPATSRSGWWLVARTKIIDDAIAEAIANGLRSGAESGRRLGHPAVPAGPPAGFRSGSKRTFRSCSRRRRNCSPTRRPRCRLTRSAVDLSDPAARDAFFDEALEGATNALVLTEGLLMYLEDRDVAGTFGGAQPARGGAGGCSTSAARG